MVDLGIYQKTQIQMKTSSQQLGVFLFKISAEFSQELDLETGMGSSLPLAHQALKKIVESLPDFENETQMLEYFKNLFATPFEGLHLSSLVLQEEESATEWLIVKKGLQVPLILKRDAFYLRIPRIELNKVKIFELQFVQKYEHQGITPEADHLKMMMQNYLQNHFVLGLIEQEKSSLLELAKNLLKQFQGESLSLKDPMSDWLIQVTQ